LPPEPSARRVERGSLVIRFSIIVARAAAVLRDRASVDSNRRVARAIVRQAINVW
jgi:hypothetical protein